MPFTSDLYSSAVVQVTAAVVGELIQKCRNILFNVVLMPIQNLILQYIHATIELKEEPISNYHNF